MKAWKWATGLAVVFFAAVAGVNRYLSPFDLQAERREAARAGIPLSAADLPLRPVPPAENAVPTWVALAAALKRAPVSPPDERVMDDDVKRHGFLTADGAGAAKQLLADQAGALAMAHVGAAKPGYYVAHSWMPNELFAYLAAMRGAVKLLRLESRVLAYEGRYVEAVHTMSMGFRVTAQAFSDPMLIPHLVGLAVEAITLSGLEEVLKAAGPNAAVDDAVERAVGAVPSPDLPRALKGETLMGETLLHQMPELIRQGKKRGPTDGMAAGMARRSGPLTQHFLWDAQEATYLHWMRLTVQAAEKPEPERLAASRQIQKDLDAQATRAPAYRYTYFLVPVFAKVQERNDRLLAAQRVAIAAADIMACKAKGKSFPERLPDGLAKTAVDPYTQQPLRYRREGAGFVVFSAGPDGTFQGGWPGIAYRNDVYFRYPGP